MNEGDHKSMVKIMFWLEADAWHGHSTETLWAEPIEQGEFRLKNVPFHAFGVSAEDVITAKPTSNGLEFDRVAGRGGHSTYRLLVKEGASPQLLAQYWSPLEAMGCTYEGGEHGLRAVDVPPSANIHDVYALLQAGEDQDVWGFEEGYCGHPVS